jgi:sugar lactone lactonase YvrE
VSRESDARLRSDVDHDRPDGAYYIGHLNGLPILAGSSSVWRMEEGGTPQVYLAGFTWIIGLAFDGNGNLYVLQHSDGPLTNSGGSLTRVKPDGTREKVIEKLQRPGGLAIDADGAVYISMVEGQNFAGPGVVRRYVIP